MYIGRATVVGPLGIKFIHPSPPHSKTAPPPPPPVNGNDEHLACPTKEEAAPYLDTLKIPGAEDTLRGYGFTCYSANSTRVSLLSVMDGASAGPRERRDGKGPAPDAATAAAAKGVTAPAATPAAPKSGGGKKLAPAAIAGAGRCLRSWSSKRRPQMLA